MQAHGLLVVAEVISEDRQRQLRRAGAAIAPLEPGRAAIEEIEARIKRPAARRAALAYLYRNAVSAALAVIDLRHPHALDCRNVDHWNTRRTSVRIT